MGLLRLLTPNSDDAEWLRHVKEHLEKDESGASGTSSDTCIVGIGNPFLRFLKPEAYTPQVISIGPYHHKSAKQYEETDGYKLKMARALESEFPGFKIKTLVDYIKSSDEQIRAFYDRDIPHSQEMLSWMLALDTSFVLQFLNSIYRPHSFSLERTKELDPVLLSKRKTPFWYAITNDILMLENQVPMFLLFQALCLTTKPDTQRLSPNQREMSRDIATMYLEGGHLADILQAACAHFNPFVRQKEYLQPPMGLSGEKHVLDYLYQYITASYPGVARVSSKPSEKMASATVTGNLPSATELIEAGIKFAPYTSGDLNGIKFKVKSSTFRLPKITMNSCTEVVLRNLVALESNLEMKHRPLTRYIYLMDRLIDTEKDVAVLMRSGILTSQMSSKNEVAQMWNSMGTLLEVSTFDPIDEAIAKAKENYRRNKWRGLLAEFQRIHCSKPWVLVSVISAGILLLLTVIQVFCLFYTCNK